MKPRITNNSLQPRRECGGDVSNAKQPKHPYKGTNEHPCMGIEEHPYMGIGEHPYMGIRTTYYELKNRDQL